MSEALKQYIHRDPRYVYQTVDNGELIFSHVNQKERLHADIHNLSASGMAFITDTEDAPTINTELNFEFSVPSGKKMAWTGQVTRHHSIRRQGQDKVLIAVAFKKLPLGHKENIETGITKSFKKLQFEYKKKQAATVLYRAYDNRWSLILFISLTIFAIWFFYTFTQPSPNYDPSRGAPWGQRF